jgi:hypothetical protein
MCYKPSPWLVGGGGDVVECFVGWMLLKFFQQMTLEHGRRGKKHVLGYNKIV